MFGMIPDVCLAFALGGAGTSLPPRKHDFFVDKETN